MLLKRRKIKVVVQTLNKFVFFPSGVLLVRFDKNSLQFLIFRSDTKIGLDCKSRTRGVPIPTLPHHSLLPV